MRDRIDAWKAAFETDEQAVLPTLVNLAWDFASFQTFAQLVAGAPDEEDGGKRFNQIIFHLAGNGFWNSTFMTIRRLLDRAPLHGRAGVCSLQAIINDVRAVRHRLTRLVYLEDIARVPYDPEAVRLRRRAFVEAQGGGPVYVPRDLWPESSEQRQAEFDWLSGVASDARSEGDLIQESVFDRLDARLRTLDGIYEHATVQFAHASTEASRRGRVLPQFSLAEAKDALRLLTETAELVGRWFCFSGVGDVLPTAQFNQFAYLEDPLFRGDMEALRARWDAFDDESGQWCRIENDQL